MISIYKYKFTTESVHEFDIPEYNGKPYNLRNHHGDILASVDPKGTLIVYPSYSWDGCTPKFELKLFGKKVVFGVWDGRITYEGKQQLYYPTMVHDVLCQIYYAKHGINFYSRKDIDVIFHNSMREPVYEISGLIRKTYYVACRVFGIIHKLFKRY